MKRQGEMQVNVAGLRRNLKNLAHNYSDAQKKVREATSNDPWGPSSTLMTEIADLTYNVVAFTEIMQMIWKRLNDHGRNWRHVYKALVLLEYLIKRGSEKVGQQCKENIYAIQTLKDFQYIEEGKDHGLNVREKAKQLVNLLKDDERLRNERARALKAKERFAQSVSGFGIEVSLDTPTSPRYPAFQGWGSTGSSREMDLTSRELENARPQTVGEEELQLQLALAMSREEAEQEEQKRRSDDVRLQLALSQSQQDFKKTGDKPSHMLDLLDVNLGEAASADPWGVPQPPRSQNPDPWKSTDPWLPAPQGTAASSTAGATGSSGSHHLPADPWLAASKKNDPWSPVSGSSSTDLDEFDVITNRNRAASPRSNGTPQNNNANGAASSSSSGSNSHANNNASNDNDPFVLSLLDESLPGGANGAAAKKTPQSFLGENSALVNLDNLISKTNASTTSAAAPSAFNAANPFSETPSRPVFQPPPPKPTINQIKQQQPFGQQQAAAQDPWAPVQDPWMPVGSSSSATAAGGAAAAAPNPWTKQIDQPNPFLS